MVVIRADRGQQFLDFFQDHLRHVALVAVHQQKALAQRRHSPAFARVDRGERDILRQAVQAFAGGRLLERDEVLQTLAVMFLADFPQWDALGLIHANGDELQPVLLAKGLDVAALRRIQQSQCAIVADGALGDFLRRLTVGGENAVLSALGLDGLDQFFDGIFAHHGAIVQHDSVTVKSKFARPAPVSRRVTKYFLR